MYEHPFSYVKAFFFFSLFLIDMKLGASSPEDAARWINLIKEEALKVYIVVTDKTALFICRIRDFIVI